MAKRKSNSKAGAPKKAKVHDVDESSNGQDEEEYEVEKIIHHRKFSNGDVEYLVRWKGYGSDDDTWEKESNLTSSALIIAEYKDSLPDSSADEDNTNGKHEDEKDIDEDDHEFTPKKKGAPKKSKKAKAVSAKKETPKKASKGRGRPKGKAVKKDASDDEDEEEERVEEFEVERIIDVHSGKHGKKEYLVRWKGYSSKDDTWEPEEHLTCPDLIEAFTKKLEKIKGASEKSLRVAPQKTNRLILQKPSGRHSKRNVGHRKSYAEDD